MLFVRALVCAAIGCSPVALSQEPLQQAAFPGHQISQKEWEKTLSEVKAAPGAKITADGPLLQMIEISPPQGQRLLYMFTLPPHPAHPALLKVLSLPFPGEPAAIFGYYAGPKDEYDVFARAFNDHLCATDPVGCPKPIQYKTMEFKPTNLSYFRHDGSLSASRYFQTTGAGFSVWRGGPQIVYGMILRVERPLPDGVTISAQFDNPLDEKAPFVVPIEVTGKSRLVINSPKFEAMMKPGKYRVLVTVRTADGEPLVRHEQVVRLRANLDGYREALPEEAK